MAATREGGQSPLLSQRPWRGVLIGVTLAVDVAAVFAGYYLARLILDLFFGTTAVQVFRPIVFATVAIWPVVFALFGLYSPRRLMRVSLAELLRGCAAAVVATLLVLLVTSVAQIDPRREYLPLLLVCCLLTAGYGRVVTRLLALYANDWMKR
jgi:hypothetical protein